MTKALTKRSTHHPLKERAAARGAQNTAQGTESYPGAERLLKGKGVEGSFRAGGLNAGKTGREVGLHELSPLSDRTLIRSH